MFDNVWQTSVIGRGSPKSDGEEFFRVVSSKMEKVGTGLRVAEAGGGNIKIRYFLQMETLETACFTADREEFP
jgi:hypothetical protein